MTAYIVYLPYLSLSVCPIKRWFTVVPVSTMEGRSAAQTAGPANKLERQAINSEKMEVVDKRESSKQLDGFFWRQDHTRSTPKIGPKKRAFVFVLWLVSRQEKHLCNLIKLSTSLYRVTFMTSGSLILVVVMMQQMLRQIR